MAFYTLKGVVRTAALLLYCFVTYCNSFIIPNELPSILSIIYSNIPPVKVAFKALWREGLEVDFASISTSGAVGVQSRQETGIDTRLGWGFRLGPHADYQTLIEIGPQTNTNPISTNGTVSKRQSDTPRRTHRLFTTPKDAAGKSRKETKGKKVEKTLFGKIEFKKVPGIDEAHEKAKVSKAEKVNESSPTKFVLL